MRPYGAPRHGLLTEVCTGGWGWYKMRHRLRMTRWPRTVLRMYRLAIAEAGGDPKGVPAALRAEVRALLRDRSILDPNGNTIDVDERTLLLGLESMLWEIAPDRFPRPRRRRPPRIRRRR